MSSHQDNLEWLRELEDHYDWNDQPGARDKFKAAADELQQLRAEREKQSGYSIALQRAIEHNYEGLQVPTEIAAKCPHHAAKLNASLTRRNDVVDELPARIAALEAERENLDELVAVAYQLAGLVDAPERFLDAFATRTGSAETLLPVTLAEIGALEARDRLLRELVEWGSEAKYAEPYWPNSLIARARQLLEGGNTPT